MDNAEIFTVSIPRLKYQDIFRILADYRLRHLVNNFAIHIYTHDYIRMKITVFENFTASIVDLMVANIRLLAQFAIIKSPFDAVKFSNTIQLSPISHDDKIVDKNKVKERGMFDS